MVWTARQYISPLPSVVVHSIHSFIHSYSFNAQDDNATADRQRDKKEEIIIPYLYSNASPTK